MRILGVSALYHDNPAALVEDGEIVAAAREARFSRGKHDARFPASAVAYCLAQAGVALEEINHVASSDKRLLKFERLPRDELTRHARI